MSENLGDTISRMVAEKLDASFVEKVVETRVEKLVVEAVDHALRSYSDTGKLIATAVEDALRVDRIDLPTYGSVVTAMLKAQIEAKVADLVAGRLASDMDELLSLAPKEVKLSEIAKAMLEENHEEYGPDLITVIVEYSDTVGSSGGFACYAHVYLDETEHFGNRDKFRCRHRLALDDKGVIYSATVDDRDLKTTKQIGRSYGIAQKLRAYVACGTKLILDEDDVVTGKGDY